ncbi:hypothetical protein ACF1BE_15280 [Streptomyces sp. NPDC014991]|uniref:hypothetical protein n=1 Tax=Streptomyces sp. NPDC014991 TaxID=3364935 RepID=UPI0036F6FF1C
MHHVVVRVDALTDLEKGPAPGTTPEDARRGHRLMTPGHDPLEPWAGSRPRVSGRSAPSAPGSRPGDAEPPVPPAVLARATPGGQVSGACLRRAA